MCDMRTWVRSQDKTEFQLTGNIRAECIDTCYEETLGYPEDGTYTIVVNGRNFGTYKGREKVFNILNSFRRHIATNRYGTFELPED